MSRRPPRRRGVAPIEVVLVAGILVVIAIVLLGVLTRAAVGLLAINADLTGWPGL